MKLKIRVTLTEEMLGMSPSSQEICREFIASKAPDAKTTEEEVEAIGVEAVLDKGRTVFPRGKEGLPIMWDYQIKGAFKDSCGMLTRVKGTKSNDLKAYRKTIDGLVFVEPREIVIHLPEVSNTGGCDRPLRVSGPSGERVALASSETVPAGSWIEFEVTLLNKAHEPILREWLDYWKLRGLGQWRNSGKGRATWELIEKDGKQVQKS